MSAISWLVFIVFVKVICRSKKVVKDLKVVVDDILGRVERVA